VAVVLNTGSEVGGAPISKGQTTRVYYRPRPRARTKAYGLGSGGNGAALKPPFLPPFSQE
jgi:hypothetical protein